MNTARKFALQLASLGRRDRAWVLSRLSAQEKGRIRPLLHDFLQSSSSVLSDALRRAQNGAAEQAQPSITERSPDSLSLRRASPNEVRPWVRALPQAAAVVLLQLENWPWREEVLGSLKAEWRRAADGRSIPNTAATRAFADWLAQRVAEKIRGDRAKNAGSRDKFEALID